MAATQIIKQKYDIISYVTGLNDKNSVQELYNWINAKEEENVVHLSSEQKELLLMSEYDIRNGRLVSENDLNKSELYVERKQKGQNIFAYGSKTGLKNNISEQDILTEIKDSN